MTSGEASFGVVPLENSSAGVVGEPTDLLIEQPVVWRTAQSYGRENLQRSHHEHDELLAAFARGDGAWAAAMMTAHIRRAFHAYRDAYQAQLGDQQLSAA